MTLEHGCFVIGVIAQVELVIRQLRTFVGDMSIDYLEAVGQSTNCDCRTTAAFSEYEFVLFYS